MILGGRLPSVKSHEDVAVIEEHAILASAVSAEKEWENYESGQLLC